MAKKKRRPRGSLPDGLTVDAEGNPAIDPTANVIALVEAAMLRQDDLRTLEAGHVREMFALRHEATVAREAAFREAAELRDRHQQEMRAAEADRLDAIRSVDVAAVQQAATVQAAAASALETTVSAAAETLRTTVAATAAAAATELRSTVAPLTEAIADLRRVQYEQQGQRVAAVETQHTQQISYGQIIAVVALVLTFLSIAAAVAIALVTS